MIHNLKPYPAYKDSGVPWLGQVPEHWEVRRTKTVLRERSEKGYPDEPLLAATQTKGVVRKDQYENRTVLALKDLHLLKLVRVGDFVISLRSFQGGIEYAREHGIISPAYTILYPIDNRLQGYLALLFKSKAYIENLSLFITGIREGQNIDYQKLSRSEIPIPPLPEQSAIVRYLDYMDRRIRRYIHAKQKLIKLLEEQKQAIIHRAVTRGLDPNVKLKPSGVEWLGDVPEGWEIQPGMVVFSEKNVKNIGLLEKQVLSLSYGEIVIKPEEKLHGLVPESFETYQIVEPSNIIIRSTDLQNDKKSLRVGLVKNKGIITSAYICLQVNSLVNSNYAYQLLHTYDITKILYMLGSGLRQNLSFSDFKRLTILIPPLAEQKSIIDFIEAQTEDMVKAVFHAKQEIRLLHEYRTRLIADVVTGKLDVREAAASLPNEVEEPDVLEDGLGEDEGLDDEQTTEFEEEDGA